MGKFISKEEIAGLRKMVELGQITEEVAANIIIEGTPSMWIEANLGDVDEPDKPIKLRPYQLEVLQDAKSIALRWGRQIGKEQPYSSRVLTPQGFVKMGSLKVGDTVYGVDGKPAQVLEIFEQGVKDVYELTFDDGSKVKCGLEHLWALSDENGNIINVLPLKDFITNKDIKIPLCKPIHMYRGTPIINRMFEIEFHYEFDFSKFDKEDTLFAKDEDEFYFMVGHFRSLGIHTTASTGSSIHHIKLNPKKYKSLVSVKLVDREESRCITVNNDSHTYITDGFTVTHNTVVLSGRLLWEIFTEENLSVVLYAPTKKHLNDIFDYVEKMLKTNKELISMIKKEDRTQKSAIGGLKGKDAIPKIELINGSSIKFFHTQTKKSWEQIRGTKGDKLFFDETAFIAPQAFTALSGLLTSANNLFIWAQSTPLGAEGWYYDFCQNAEIHSHHTSMESPSWNPEKEKLARLLAPDEGSFDREYRARFVSGGSSAFMDETIDIARDAALFDKGQILYQGKSYLSSAQIEQMPGNTYIGVDWNIAANGTKITVWKEPAGMAGRIIYQDVISIEHPVYTQMTAVDELFRLCEKYQPIGIGLDKGYGALSLEIIADKLEQEKYKWLNGRFEVVNFGEILYIPVVEFFGESVNLSYEIETIKKEDNTTEEMVKLPLKVFMVSVMTRLMLSEKIALPPVDIDKERKLLINELKSVKIEKVSSNGYPVYSKVNLHKFASAMLATYVYFLKSGNFHIVKEDNKKVIRKQLEGPVSVNKSAVDLWAPVNPNFFKPKLLTNRGLSASMAGKGSDPKLLKQEMKQMGIVTIPVHMGGHDSSKPKSSGMSWANRSKAPSRRRI
ncbi:MAG: hypothetical protein E6R13_10305 [Spirochaetes bacterium]|nr:MAG: hypothetical protein E6R13_10305 [Spirochaetota bacterium]